jgi:hypothetical protein
MLKPRQFSNDGVSKALSYGPYFDILEPALQFAVDYPALVDKSTETFLSMFILVNLMPNSLLINFRDCSFYCWRSIV